MGYGGIGIQDVGYGVWDVELEIGVMESGIRAVSIEYRVDTGYGLQLRQEGQVA